MTFSLANMTLNLILRKSYHLSSVNLLALINTEMYLYNIYQCIIFALMASEKLNALTNQFIRIMFIYLEEGEGGFTP